MAAEQQKQHGNAKDERELQCPGQRPVLHRCLQPSRENKDYASYDDEDCYVIAGTKGSLSIPTMRLKTCGSSQVPSWFEPYETSVAAIHRRDPLELQLAHFCAVIRGEATPLVTALDGLQNLRIVEAIARAAQSGMLVNTTA